MEIFRFPRAGWLGDYEDPNTFLDTLRPNRGTNETGWNNDTFDQLVAKANATLDQDERYNILMEAFERLLIDEMPIAPI